MAALNNTHQKTYNKVDEWLDGLEYDACHLEHGLSMHQIADIKNSGGFSNELYVEMSGTLNKDIQILKHIATIFNNQIQKMTDKARCVMEEFQYDCRRGSQSLHVDYKFKTKTSPRVTHVENCPKCQMPKSKVIMCKAKNHVLSCYCCFLKHCNEGYPFQCFKCNAIKNSNELETMYCPKRVKIN